MSSVTCTLFFPLLCDDEDRTPGILQVKMHFHYSSPRQFLGKGGKDTTERHSLTAMAIESVSMQIRTEGGVEGGRKEIPRLIDSDNNSP